ncbi:hypothetical protein [Nitrososphaera sp.]|uniref:hypothetical protein n=1 Tax=Nitrososphaera sp. TaxID=1971748 RepID=UPI002ED938AE
MGSQNIDSKMRAHDAYNAAQTYIRASALEIKETEVDKRIVAGGERAYDTTILIILLIIVGVFALIYYFTRKKNALSLTITSKEEGCSVSIEATGPKGEAVLHFLSDVIR